MLKIELDATPALVKLLGPFVNELRRFNDINEKGDDEDAPKKRRSSKDDDEEDEAPKKRKSSRDEDEEDDEPVKKKRRASDDDDEEEAPKKKRRASDDEDEEVTPTRDRVRELSNELTRGGFRDEVLEIVKSKGGKSKLSLVPDEKLLAVYKGFQKLKKDNK